MGFGCAGGHNRRGCEALGYASRVLLLASVGGLAGVFACEMLLGGFVVADQRAAVALIDTFNSRVLVALVPGLLAFFIGVGLFVVPMASLGGPLRWPALGLGLGALLILAEIMSAQVVLSQIGNTLIFIAGVGFARVRWSLALVVLVAAGSSRPLVGQTAPSESIGTVLLTQGPTSLSVW